MDLDLPSDASAVAVLLHPHPDMGGNRHNHVVGALYKGLPAAGVGVVRFDFTSSDLSVAAAETVATIDRVATDVPTVLVGYSFGAMVAMLVPDERLAGWFLVAPVVDRVTGSRLPDDPRPKAIAMAEHDVFASPAMVEETTAGWGNTERHFLAGADHFLAGGTEALVDLVVAWVSAVIV